MKDFDNGWISRNTVPLKNSLKYRFTGGIKPHTGNKKVLTGMNGIDFFTVGKSIVSTDTCANTI